jgi:hypothetical protein
VRTDGVVLFQPALRDGTDLLQIIKQLSIQNIFTESSIEALNIGVLRRLAGLDVDQFNLFLPGQLSNLWEINSGPLSMRICFGVARQSMMFSNTQTTRSAGKEVSTSIPSASRL